MKTEIISTTKAKLWLDKDSIIHLTWNPGAEITIEDTREAKAAILQISQGFSAPLINDIREVKSISQEARTFVSIEGNSSLVSSAALLVGSLISRVIGNFFLGINKPPTPVSLFTDEEKARMWLLTFMEDNKGH
ncbi:MAG: hypothetical protein H6636_13785 [Anaerolineales bacterium]|nr:hypothetical protein [Anaerolineales bacterium]